METNPYFAMAFKVKKKIRINTVSGKRKKLPLSVAPTAKRVVRKKPARKPSSGGRGRAVLAMPSASPVVRFSVAPPDNLPFEKMIPAESMAMPTEPVISSSPIALAASMRSYGTLVVPPEQIHDAPPGSAAALVSAHEVEEYGLKDEEPSASADTGKRWWKFCLSPRQSFWLGAIFGIAAMSLLTMSLWVLVANNAVQVALR